MSVEFPFGIGGRKRGAQFLLPVKCLLFCNLRKNGGGERVPRRSGGARRWPTRVATEQMPFVGTGPDCRRSEWPSLWWRPMAPNAKRSGTTISWSTLLRRCIESGCELATGRRRPPAEVDALRGLRGRGAAERYVGSVSSPNPASVCRVSGPADAAALASRAARLSAATIIAAVAGTRPAWRWCPRNAARREPSSGAHRAKASSRRWAMAQARRMLGDVAPRWSPAVASIRDRRGRTRRRSAAWPTGRSAGLRTSARSPVLVPADESGAVGCWRCVADDQPSSCVA